MVFYLVAVIRNQIRGFLNVADTFEPVLACFKSHQRRQFPPVRAYRVSNTANQLQPFLPRPGCPHWIRCSCGSNCLPHVFACALLEPADEDRCVDRTPIVKLLVSSERFAVDVNGVLAAECLRGGCYGFVKCTMKIVELLTAECCIGDLHDIVHASGAG